MFTKTFRYPLFVFLFLAMIFMAACGGVRVESGSPSYPAPADSTPEPEVINPAEWEQGDQPAPSVDGGITLQRETVEAMGQDLAAQVTALKNAGWSDQAIYEAYTEGTLPVQIQPELQAEAFGLLGEDEARIAEDAASVPVSAIELPAGLFNAPVAFGATQVISRPFAYEVEMDGSSIMGYTIHKTATGLSLPNDYEIRPVEAIDERVYEVVVMVGDCPVVAAYEGGFEIDRFTMSSPDGWDEGVCVRHDDLDLVVAQGELRLNPSQGRKETFIYINPAYSHINGYYGDNPRLTHRDHRYRYEQIVPVNEVVKFSDPTRPVHVGLGGAISWRVDDFALLYANQYGMMPMRYGSPAVLIDEAGFNQLILCQEVYNAAPGQMCVLPGQVLTFEIMVLPGSSLEAYHDYPWAEWLTHPEYCGVAAWYNRTITTENGQGLVACGSEWTQYTLFGFPAAVVPNGTPIDQVPAEWVMWWGLGTPPQYDPQAVGP
jgi:hypothetical protein